MTICCVTGEKTQEYLISEVTKRVADGHELLVTESSQLTFRDYNALGRPISIPSLTQLLRGKIAGDSKEPWVIVLPDLSAPVEVFADLFKYLQLANHLPVDIYIGMSQSVVAPKLEEFATIKIHAAENRIYIDTKYTYFDRGQVNDTIYSALVTRQNRKG